MSAEDVARETDAFLERSGPPSLDFPFHRDNYYMLEAYLPNRGWNAEEQRWMYVPESQHETDVQFIVRWMNRKAEEQRLMEERRKEEEARKAEIHTTDGKTKQHLEIQEVSV
jgi:hypothetical protein